MSVNAASLVDLKAELARKQAEFKEERLNPELRDLRLQEEKLKKSTGWLKANKGVHLRNQRDLMQEAEDTKSLQKVEAALKAKAALYERLRRGNMTEEEQERYLVDFERKMIERAEAAAQAAEEAEQRRRQEVQSPAARDAGRYDSIRHYDQSQSSAIAAAHTVFGTNYDEDQLVDYIDEFGRKRQCKRRDLPSIQALDKEGFNAGGAAVATAATAATAASAEPSTAAHRSFVSGDDRPSPESWAAAETERYQPELMSSDMRRELERQDWEKQQKQEMSAGPIHYETVRQGEIRQLGTGYFQFSTDEKERAKQMQALHQLRAETEEGRQKRSRLLERREAAKHERLAKIRQRKAAAGLLADDSEPAAKRSANGLTGEAEEGGTEPSVEAFLSEIFGSANADQP